MNQEQLIAEAQKFDAHFCLDFPEEAAALIAKFAALLGKSNPYNMEVINNAREFVPDVDGNLCGLIAGDMCYEETGIKVNMTGWTSSTELLGKNAEPLCDYCNGSGEATYMAGGGEEAYEQLADCHKCKGTGNASLPAEQDAELIKECAEACQKINPCEYKNEYEEGYTNACTDCYDAVLAIANRKDGV